MRSRFMRREVGMFGAEAQKVMGILGRERGVFGVGCIAEAWRRSNATATVSYCKDDARTFEGSVLPD